MNQARKRLRRWQRFLLISCITLWVTALVVSHIPPERLAEGPVGDKWLHFIGFFVLASSFDWTLFAYRHPRPRRIALVASVMALYAAFDEITQPMFNRYGDIMDWYADMVGMIAAVIVWEVFLITHAKIQARRSSTAKQNVHQRP